VVDEDIDPRDPDAVNWALSFRMQPQRDILMCGGRISPIDPSASPPETPHEISAYPPPTGNSAMLIDATRKWAYSPTSLPKKEYMERARQLWDELRLPQLHPKEPWHGYSLGDWDKENEEEALLATQGDYYKTAEKLAKTKVRWS
jgi:3-polyprenyl-4-hydroxybenzoate decarboxylase